MSSLPAKRIFISFLGTGHYGETKYEHLRTDGISSSTRFIQIARLEDLREADLSPDAIRIFVTEKAKETNWEDHGNRHTKTGESYLGLHTELRSQGWSADVVRSVDVPSGENEAQLIEIIKSIVHEVDDNTELYVDLTHGFRTMPLLLGIALRYLEKVKKNVRVEELSYGAYDASDTKTNIAPVFDMTPILALNDWAEAWARFDGSGDVEGLTALVNALRAQIGAKEAHNTPRALQDLDKTIQALHNAMVTLRPVDLVDVLQKLQPTLQKAREELEDRAELQLMLPVLQRFSQDIHSLLPPDEDRNRQELRAQLAYVQWLCERRRIQPAAVILRELLVDAMILGLEQKNGVEFADDDRPALDRHLFGLLLLAQQQESGSKGLKRSFESAREELLDLNQDLTTALNYLEGHLAEFKLLGELADRMRSLRNAHAHASRGEQNAVATNPQRQLNLLGDIATKFEAYLTGKSIPES